MYKVYEMKHFLWEKRKQKELNKVLKQIKQESMKNI